MRLFSRLRFLLRITHAWAIGRRYFVTNGFDGALTILGIMIGFYMSDEAQLPVVISACLGAAVALGVSGMSSAYISEAAERKKELRELEQALVADLSDSDHALASKYIPIFVAAVNGLSPFLISIILIAPLWWVQLGLQLPINPLLLSITLAFVILFLLGVFLGQISGAWGIWMGIKTTLIGLLTALLVFLLER
ncbi:MAG: hypothetical protein AXA67_07320 [Methylothermaceae bacteria B42]|nr:MAG: hypothetical protein AXA67_07320 [Methylothermaceae bacteria B42]HHJ40165.1 hypothetical protein [Methylothermaceae bacterium]